MIIEFPDELADADQQVRLVDLVGDLVDDDRLTVALVELLVVRARAHHDASAPGAVPLVHTFEPVDDSRGGEIRCRNEVDCPSPFLLVWYFGSKLKYVISGRMTGGAIQVATELISESRLSGLRWPVRPISPAGKFSGGMGRNRRHVETLLGQRLQIAADVPPALASLLSSSCGAIS